MTDVWENFTDFTNVNVAVTKPLTKNITTGDKKKQVTKAIS